ncbi:hypothetical protein PR048_012955 [Dryococelus australis]|uniref:Uncharacterized protein n=1 Tax=Dryococelus australis TaxID=614101 RepID=A0ABQ9HQU1_9NEOP|nr:hypothetical protein PR048_012955 [Dryococelus australis]
MGFNIDGEWIGALLLAGLPEKFPPIILAIEHSGIAISTDCVKTKLLDMESDIGESGRAFGGEVFFCGSGHSRHYQKRGSKNHEKEAKEYSDSVGDGNQKEDISSDTEHSSGFFEDNDTRNTEFGLPYDEIPEVVRRSERERKPKNFEEFVTYIYHLGLFFNYFSDTCSRHWSKIGTHAYHSLESNLTTRNAHVSRPSSWNKSS